MRGLPDETSVAVAPREISYKITYSMLQLHAATINAWRSVVHLLYFGHITSILQRIVVVCQKRIWSVNLSRATLFSCEFPGSGLFPFLVHFL